MPQNFPESDWKTLSRLKPLALDRLCQRILQGAKNIITRAQEGKYYDAYLDLYRYVHSAASRNQMYRRPLVGYTRQSLAVRQACYRIFAIVKDFAQQYHKEDQIVGNCFSDWRRSQALYLLVNWRSENLLTEEEFAEFSAETRNTVTWFLQNR